MNKKAQIATAIVDIYAYLAFVFIMIIFLVIFVASDISEIGGSVTSAQNNRLILEANLNSILHHQMAVDGMFVNLADYISLKLDNGEPLDKLELYKLPKLKYASEIRTEAGKVDQDKDILFFVEKDGKKHPSLGSSRLYWSILKTPLFSTKGNKIYAGVQMAK